MGSIEGKFIDPCTYRGFLFPEAEDLAFDSFGQMEERFNSRLFA